tara:strand:- start:5 stop:457 length:453 start_codon:yes stop_codon:yes gene_type:complete
MLRVLLVLIIISIIFYIFYNKGLEIFNFLKIKFDLFDKQQALLGKKLNLTDNEQLLAKAKAGILSENNKIAETKSKENNKLPEETSLEVTLPKPYLKHDLYKGDQEVFLYNLDEINLCPEGYLQKGDICSNIASTSKLGICINGVCSGLE